MRKNVLILTLLSVAVAFTSCKDNASDKVNDSAAEDAAGENTELAENTEATPDKFAAMTFDETEHDFGNIAQGTKVEHTFSFTNTGEVPLVITEAKSSCGCTVPQWPKEAIAPGESGEILVRFNGSGKNQVRKTVNLTANTESGREKVFIKAFVEPKEGDES